MKIQQQPEDYPEEDEEYLEAELEAEPDEYPPPDEENYIEDYTAAGCVDLELDIYASEPLNESSHLPKGKLKRSKSYDVLNVEMIEKKTSQTINEVIETLGLPTRTAATTLLRHFK